MYGIFRSRMPRLPREVFFKAWLGNAILCVQLDRDFEEDKVKSLS